MTKSPVGGADEDTGKKAIGNRAGEDEVLSHGTPMPLCRARAFQRRRHLPLEPTIGTFEDGTQQTAYLAPQSFVGQHAEGRGLVSASGNRLK
jgi:hypothetical protein